MAPYISVMTRASRDLGLTHLVPLVERVKNQKFETRIKELCARLEEDYNNDAYLAGRKKHMVFFDNCSAPSKIEDTLDLFPNVLPKRLPRYSLEVNDIEFCFFY